MTTRSSYPSTSIGHSDRISSITALLAAAGEAMGQNRPNVATRALDKALLIDPDSAEAHRLMGVVCLMRGVPAKAAEHLRCSLDLRPDDSTTYMNLGSALFECGQIDAGLASLRRACDLAPKTAPTWYNLGRALQIAGHIEEAHGVLQHALALDPAHVMTRMTLANVLNSLGDVSGAAARYREVIRCDPGHAKAWFELADLKTIQLSKADILQIERLLNTPGLNADARVWLGFALAKAYDDQKNYTASFEALKTANAIKHRHVTWDMDAEHRRIDGIIRAFSGPPVQPLDPTLGKEVIFIVCMPRSGSTLTEQILASHSQVEGANEIEDLRLVLTGESKRRGRSLTQWANLATPEDWSRLGHEYLARTARWRQSKPRFTDKNLGNWALVGPALAMLPGARIVNSRRSALETCFSCYRQLFSNGAPFSYDLRMMAHYYAGYDRISRFWKQRFPQRYHDHVYEALQEDPEGQIRQLLDFCQLTFEPACLQFHQTSRAVTSTLSAAQVRQPLQRDTARAGRYGTLLDPLRHLLHELDLYPTPPDPF